MSFTLQQIVDRLGAQLQRAVAIDDPQLRLLVHGPHHGPIDRVRLHSVMYREAPAEASWVYSLGITRTRDPMRMSGNPELDILPRVCVPIRGQDLLLGYLFYIDVDGSSDEELALAKEAADTAGMVLYQERLLAEVEHSRQRELLRDLLNDEATITQNAANELIELELFTAGARAQAFVIKPIGSSGQATTSPQELRSILSTALENCRHTVSSQHLLHMARLDHGLLIVDPNDPALKFSGALWLGEQLRTALAEQCAAIGFRSRVVVGIGDAQEQLVDARHSYRQSLQATDVAAVMPSIGDVVSWAGLGVYQLLVQLPRGEMTKTAIHPGLRKLLETDRAQMFLTTLETYLDDAGNAVKTAQDLFIHRTSLYYRLARIEELAGVDLGDGHDRLALHLGLKLARLSGFYGWGASGDAG